MNNINLLIVAIGSLILSVSSFGLYMYGSNQNSCRWVVVSPPVKYEDDENCGKDDALCLSFNKICHCSDSRKCGRPHISHSHYDYNEDGTIKAQRKYDYVECQQGKRETA